MDEKTEIEIPINALRLAENSQAEVKFEQKEGTEEDQKTRFKMVANSGNIIPNHYFWGNLGIDLEGIKLGRQKKPALRDHDPQKIIGFTDKIEINEDGQLVAEGFFTDKTEDGRLALELSLDGFPFQASIYVPPSEILKVPVNDYAYVNGQRLDGPGHIFKKSTLREVTFTAMGADEATEAGVALSENRKTTVNAVVYQFSSINEIGKEDLMQEEDQVKDADGQILNETEEKENKETSEFAVKQERARVTAILDSACSGQEKLAKDLVESGASLEEAQSAMLSDVKERMESRLSDIVDAAPASAGVEEEIEKFATKEEEMEHKFNNNEALKKEFGDAEVYFAYQRAIENGSINDKGIQ